jgi:hypothetical protein
MTDALDSEQVVIFTKETKLQPYAPGLDLLGDSSGGVVTVGALRTSIDRFMPALGVIIADVKAKAAEVGLEEVSVALGVNAKGTIGFLGTGAEMGGTASLTLKFKIG